MELVVTQITDIHIKGNDDLELLLQRTDSIVGAISETIRKPENTMLLICVTGDITFSGSKEQYNMGEIFFLDIYEKIKKRYEKLDIHFVFVPGNHDCDFFSANNNVRTTILKSSELDMNDAGTIELCTSIQNNYFDFVNRFVDKKLASPNRKNSIFTENTVINSEIGEYNIVLHCLNTSWCSSIHETKDMPFCISEEITVKEEKDIVITLMHHGENWFNWKGMEEWDRYHKKFSDIILVGHDHYSQFVHKTNYDSTSNYFIKGNQLYCNEEPNVSGFNIFKVNLQDNIEIFYTYEWNKKDKLYERIIDSKSQLFERNRFLSSKIGLAKELKEYLEDIEIDISSKYKSPLLLSDIFVFPSLRGERLDKPEKSRIYRDQESIIEIIKTKKKILIDGNKEYGKTAVLKRLFLIFSGLDTFPVFIDVNLIKSSNEDWINTIIRESYKYSYNNLNIDEVMQMKREKRVCFIDNFDETILSDKTQKAFLEYIDNQFDIVILTVNNKKGMLDAVRNLETKEYLNEKYYELGIRALSKYGRSKIIDKWLLLEDPSQDIKSLKFDAKKKAKLTQMKSVLKNGYFSNTSLEFLLVLSYVDNTEMMNADYSKYSYIYDCLIRDKINDISNKDTKSALAYKTLLETLAYELYVDTANTLFEEKYLLKAISNYNENYPPLKGSSIKIIQRLVQYKIIEERHEKFKFKYNYMYYYFAGSYIVNVLSPEEKEKKTIEILSDLSAETDYNIALFMAYSMNTQHEILPKLQNISAELLDEYKDFKYEDQRGLLEKINSNVLDKLNEIYNIPENSEIPYIQEARQIRQDELENTTSEEMEKKVQTEANEGLEVVFTDFTKLLRLIEFQGDILKNYATKIQNKPRTEIIELMGTSNLKLIGFLCDMVSGEIDKIISFVEKKAKEANQEKSPQKDILVQLIKDFLSIVWSQFIELNVNSLAACLECDLINEDVTAYKEKAQSDFFDMVNVEYKIRISDGNLPVSDIERCLSGKRKLGSFSMGIIKNIIATYLSSYQYDSVDKERVCRLLGYDYKKFFLEDQKVKVLGIEQ